MFVRLRRNGRPIMWKVTSDALKLVSLRKLGFHPDYTICSIPFLDV